MRVRLDGEPGEGELDSAAMLDSAAVMASRCADRSLSCFWAIDMAASISCTLEGVTVADNTLDCNCLEPQTWRMP